MPACPRFVDIGACLQQLQGEVETAWLPSRHSSTNPRRAPRPRADVASLMPQLKEELAQLVAIPSVSASGYPEETHEPLLATPTS